jgi:hypothetical protein
MGVVVAEGDAHGVLPRRHPQLPGADRTAQMVMGGLLVVLDLDHPYPQVLHVAKPYTERSHHLHSCDERVGGGTIYPILARLEHYGWIEGHKESAAEHLAEGRRARYYYTLTDEGAVRARAALEQARRSRGPAADLRPATS